MKGSLALLAIVSLAQPRAVDLSRAPWTAVMERLTAHDPLGASRELERIADSDRSIAPWQHAYAYRWAGRLAMESGHEPEAARDFDRAIASDPSSIDGRFSRVHRGELALRAGNDREALRWLEPVEHDPDTLIRTYAQDRLRTARERWRRVLSRRIAEGILALTALAWLVRIARPSRWKGRSQSFGRALLAAEAIAIAGTLVVHRAISQLALSGWMLAAIPSGLAAATLWATRPRERSVPREALAWMVFALGASAALYLAWDFLWWSAERPLTSA